MGGTPEQECGRHGRHPFIPVTQPQPVRRSAPLLQGVIAPAGFAQYEFLQNLPAGSAGAGIETGPGAAQYFAQKQQATTTVSQGAAQPMQTGY